MKKEDIWQYDHLTGDEAEAVKRRTDLTCAICGRHAHGGRAINGRGTGKDKWKIWAYEAYCKDCLDAAEKRAEHLLANDHRYHLIQPYHYRWELAHRNAVIVAKLDREVAAHVEEEPEATGT